MQFQVPQFIEVEDKIFGPLTIKQFIYLAGGVGVVVILWSVLPLWAAIVLGAPIVGLAAALAFYQVNGRPLIEVIEAGIHYLTKRKLYIWKQSEQKAERRKTSEMEEELREARAEGLSVPTLSQSKLKDLAWSLDVHESIYASQKDKE